MVTSLLRLGAGRAELGAGPAARLRRVQGLCAALPIWRRVLDLLRHLSFGLGQQGFFVFFVIAPQDEADDDRQG